MSRKKLLNLSDDGWAFLDAAHKKTGATDTMIIEMCLASYAVGLGVEVGKAREFLYHNVIRMIATTAIHRPPAGLRTEWSYQKTSKEASKAKLKA